MSSTTPSNEAPVVDRSVWKENRTADLLEAAETAIRARGVAASMGDIAREAGVSRVILYRYFGDKAGLSLAIAEKYVESLVMGLRVALADTDDPQARLRRTTETYVDFIEENRELYNFLMHRAVKEGAAGDVAVGDFMRRVAHEIGLVLEEDISRLGFDPKPAQAWGHGVVGMVHLATDWWLHSTGVTKAEFVDHLVALMSYGFIGLASIPELAKTSGLRRVDSS
jgi:AcrR family transcriptional regulator